MGGEGHLSLDVLFFGGVGLNSSGLLLQEEVRLMVEFCRGFTKFTRFETVTSSY